MFPTICVVLTGHFKQTTHGLACFYTCPLDTVIGDTLCILKIRELFAILFNKI